MKTENIKPKVKMPMIPLRDVVIFPNTVSHFCGREKSIFIGRFKKNKNILIAQNLPSSRSLQLKTYQK